MASQTEKRVITAAEYEAIVRPTPPVTAEELFEYELERLVEEGLLKREEADPFRAKLPKDGKMLLLMPSEPKEINLAELMARIKLNGKNGVNYLDAKHLKDLVKRPKGAYLLTGIEDGHERRNTKPRDSRKNIEREGRQPFTTFEGIIYTILFPDVLAHHYLDLVGSRYLSSSVPCLCLYGGDRPVLDDSDEDRARPVWGAPSCGAVVGA